MTAASPPASVSDRVFTGWEHPPVASWAIAVALSCAAHGALVWGGFAFWPALPLIAIEVPVDLVSPPPEAPRPEPPPVARPTPRPPIPRAEEVIRPERVPPSPSAQTETAVQPVVPVPVAPPAPAISAEMPAPMAPAVAAVPERGASAPARPDAVAATPPAPAPARVTQPARPRGGYQVRPTYPASARRAGAEGTTVLRVHIRVDGTIDEIQVSRSAGYAALDEAAAAAVTRWRFEPARDGADAVAVWVLVPVEFRLQSE